MEQEVYDSIQVLTTDSLRDSVPQSVYSFGSIIPLEKTGSVIPSDLLIRDSLSAEIYSEPRISGIPFHSGYIDNDFCFAVLSFCLLLLVLVIVYGRKSIAQSFSALSLKHQPEILSGTSYYILSWPLLLSFVFSVLNISLFISIALNITGISASIQDMSPVKMTLITGGIFTGMVFLRHITCIIVAAFSNQKQLFMEYVSVIYSAWFILSLTLFAFSTLIVFSFIKQQMALVWVAAGVAGFLILLRIIRLLNIFLKRRVLILYFILYLCALEVLPVLIILKALGVF